MNRPMTAPPENEPLRRLGGALLAPAGVLFLLAGVLHPHGKGSSFEQASAAMLQDSTWLLSHWLGLAALLVLAWAVWLLVDAGWTGRSAVAQAGARLTILSAGFMAVQTAVEVAAQQFADAYAAGEAEPLFELLEVMQVLGWPALGAGVALLALGTARSAPRLVSAAAAVGGVAVGVAGVLVMGLHIMSVAPLFAGTNLVTLWIIWAGRARRSSGAGPPERHEPGRGRGGRDGHRMSGRAHRRARDLLAQVTGPVSRVELRGLEPLTPTLPA
jgi:hypothetical protein